MTVVGTFHDATATEQSEFEMPNSSTCCVAHAQGPERIGSEWWRSSQPTRDYYLVEDDDGRRFWLYREGLYERETNAPRWFVQGLFA